MPRPCKQKRICRLPRCTHFVPENNPSDRVVKMSLEEYETIRLIDYEKMNQEECAKQMNVARTTIQSIYQKARYKVALSLVEGIRLVIDGGDYQLCEQKTSKDDCRACCQKRE
ncbi:MAG: DUF134 domain-containing protein [Erysipelotrichia bacterium]|nr:DUF134 domain-containing protein [Erysipelotrichia bacterium]NCC54132.1 DUF134 domain-containing protein [Erysipelotrichia bacterium]